MLALRPRPTSYRKSTKLRNFLTALRDEFDVGIVTLNYDNIFTQALPDLYTGFEPTTGVFEPLEIQSRSTWDFIYHLHGSIHFEMTGSPYDMHGITWAPTPIQGHTLEAFGRNTQVSLGGPAFPTSIIVAGYGKTQQMLRQPFLTLFAQLSRLASEADSLLFRGYGFADLHLNAAFSEVRKRRRPAVVVDFAEDNQDPMQFRYDTWAYNLLKALPANKRFAKPGRISPPGVSELKAENEVECSNDPNNPVAIWYGGFLEACRHLERLLPHLA